MTSEERRAAILTVAVRLFAERGFRGTTTRALADAVGVTEPVLYEHFKSKRDLYCAITEAKSHEGISRAAALLQPYADARDDRGLFTALGHFILDYHEQDEDYVRLLLSVALEDRELGSLFYERQQPARDGLARYIQQRTEEGAFRDVDPHVAARAFLGMFFQQSLVVLLYRDRFVRADRGRVVSEMVDLFLRGIAKNF